MKIALRYFSGTGNSKRIAEECKQVFEENSNIVDLSSITKNIEIQSDAGLVGFVFPVYAFGIPRICRSYLKRIKYSEKNRKAFVIISAGSKDESGFSIQECKEYLKKRNIDVVYSAVVQMPINWTTFSVLQPSNEVSEVLKSGINEARQVAEDILAGRNQEHHCKKPVNYNVVKFYLEYLLFKSFGVYFMWRLFATTDKCNGCGKCSKVCPTKCIKMTNRKPTFKDNNDTLNQVSIPF